jgi:hypothetical protein
MPTLLCDTPQSPNKLTGLEVDSTSKQCSFQTLAPNGNRQEAIRTRAPENTAANARRKRAQKESKKCCGELVLWCCWWKANVGPSQVAA